MSRSQPASTPYYSLFHLCRGIWAAVTRISRPAIPEYTRSPSYWGDGGGRAAAAAMTTAQHVQMEDGTAGREEQQQQLLRLFLGEQCSRTFNELSCVVGKNPALIPADCLSVCLSVGQVQFILRWMPKSNPIGRQ